MKKGKPTPEFAPRTWDQWLIEHRLVLNTGQAGKIVRQVHLGMPSKCSRCKAEIRRFDASEDQYEIHKVRLTTVGRIVLFVALSMYVVGGFTAWYFFFP